MYGAGLICAPGNYDFWARAFAKEWNERDRGWEAFLGMFVLFLLVGLFGWLVF